MTQYIWRLSEAGPGNLGLAVSDDGLLLGRTPLVERRNGRFVVRGREEIERLLRHGHRYIGEADRLMPGPAGVARALNTVDPCMARVAAVHLRLPDLPSLTARDAMEVEDLLIKYASANWDPEKHPRTGAPPNPGWFAPTGGAVDDDTPRVRVAEDDDSTRRSDASPGIGDDSARARSAQNDADTARSNASSAAGNDWVHLPPGKRIDELGDFLEWLANAKPEDEKAIRTEISRYYIDAGNLYAASVLRDALKQALDPNLDRQARQELLNSIEVFSRYDPADARRTMDLFGQLVLLFGVGALPRLRATGPTIAGTAPAELNPLSNSSATAAEAALAEADAAAWKLGWAARGRYIDVRLERNLHPNFPVVDKFSEDGIVTSIKSIDLGAATYQDPTRLTYRINKYIADLVDFDGAALGDDEINASEISGRALHLAVPKGRVSPIQREAIEAIRARERMMNDRVDILISEF